MSKLFVIIKSMVLDLTPEQKCNVSVNNNRDVLLLPKQQSQVAEALANLSSDSGMDENES